MRLTAWVGGVDAEKLLEASEVAAAHSYFVRRSRQEAQHLMGEEAEELLSALNPSSGRAWAKLHGDLISRTTITKTLPGREEAEYPLTELRNLQSDADRRAAESCLRSRVGAAGPERRPFRRCYEQHQGAGERDQLEARLRVRAGRSAVRQPHHSASLEAMQRACRDQFPVFRRYLKAKAKFLGKDTLAWYDLLAPVSVGTPRSFSWAETRDFVTETFGSYSEELATFAKKRSTRAGTTYRRARANATARFV